MKRWVPFWLWFLLFWPVIGLAETAFPRIGYKPLADDGGVSAIILAIVWLVLLFEMKPGAASEDDDSDDDDEDVTSPNATIVVTCAGDSARLLSRELFVQRIPEVNKYITIDNDVMRPTSANVTNVGQVFDGSSIEWRISVRVDFKEQFEQLAASDDWDLVTHLK